MRLFFKHLINSIKTRPLQPLILLFTMLLAMVVNISAFGLREFIDTEMLYTQKAQYGKADIAVTLNGESRSRFMFTHEVNELLGENANAAGCYELPLYLNEGEQTAFGVATDFSEIGNIFELEFSEYGEISEAQVNETALISRAFANEYALAVGNSFTVHALGYKKTYVVQGISETRFLASYDVMVHITGVMRLLATDSLFVSALGDGFKPCSTIYIDVQEGVSVQECIELLKTKTTFADKSFTIVSDTAAMWGDMTIPNVVLNIVVAVIGMLAAAVVFGCFYILSAQRTEENAIFKAAGAKPWQLMVLQYAEMFLYWILGAGLGLVLSIPMLRFIIFYAGFQFALPKLSAATAVKSSATLLLVALLTTTAFVLVEKMRQKPKGEVRSVKGVAFALLGAFLLLFIGMFFLPIKRQRAWSFACGVLLIAMLFVGIPLVFRFVMKRMDNHRERKTRETNRTGAAPMYCAVKNVYSVKVLHNTCRLFALLCALSLCAVLSIVSVNGYVANYVGFLDGEYAVINATESCKQKVVECESVESVYSVYFGTASRGRSSLQVLSVSDLEAVSEHLKPTALPKGNQAVLTEGYAKMTSLKVGDNFTVVMNEKKYELTVFQLINSDLTLIIFDCTHFGISYNMLSVTGKEGVSDRTFRQELTDALALELTAVMPIEDILTNRLQSVRIILNCGDLLIPIMLIFCVLGMGDNLLESYRARKEEFRLFELCGMSKKEIRLMKLSELMIVFLFGAMVGLLAFGAGAVILNQALQTLGFGLFMNL